MRERANRRLSVLQTVPEEVLADVQWAFDMVRAERMQQIDILSELNTRFAKAGHAPISASALNRWVLRVRSGQIDRPGGKASAPLSTSFVISPATRAHLARALRALADDIEGAMT